MAKDMFPGKRNSLDALCDRLGVDNSGRTLHGALLDAELLADGYIYMTRGQDALLIEVEDSSDSKKRADAIDMQSLKLTVICASEQELGAHEEVLLQIDKASNGQTLWRSA
jgi:DNA polymerase-3 subunit epsilon